MPMPAQKEAREDGGQMRVLVRGLPPPPPPLPSKTIRKWAAATNKRGTTLEWESSKTISKACQPSHRYQNPPAQKNIFQSALHPICLKIRPHQAPLILYHGLGTTFLQPWRYQNIPGFVRPSRFLKLPDFCFLSFLFFSSFFSLSS